MVPGTGGQRAGHSLTESLLQSAPWICGPYHYQAITCLMAGLALLGGGGNGNKRSPSAGAFCVLLYGGALRLREGSSCPHSAGWDTVRPGFCPGLCTTPPPEARSWTSPQQPPPNVTSLRHMLGLRRPGWGEGEAGHLSSNGL